ncbi:MAG: fatty acid desaturase family protein [Thalassolituus sp.]
MTDTHDDFETGLERKSARDTLTQLLGPEVIASLHRRSDAWGWFGIASCWATFAFALFMAKVAIDAFTWWSLPLLIIAISLIGGRILGLAILSHEGAHRTLFKTQTFNDSVCNWLCAAPIFIDIAKYRRHHALHHVHTGTELDVDLPLCDGFPTSPASMMRKFMRDISGMTGIKSLIGLGMMNAGILKWNVAGTVEKLPSNGQSKADYFWTFIKESRRTLIFHGVFFLSMFFSNLTELYFIWWAGYLFAYPFCIRVRSIAEHAMTEHSGNMLKNTRTTKAGIIGRALFAPFNVNFHIEHHALVSVPYWQLPKLHRLLREKQAVPNPPSYWQVMRLAASNT